MLPRSGNRFGFALITLSLVWLAGCGTSGSRPATVADDRADQVLSPAVESAGTSAPGQPLAPPVEVPERARASYARALAAFDAEDWFEAEVELEQLILEYPSFAGPYVNLSILYRRDDRLDEAESALDQALAIAPDHPAANNELGVLYREQGNFSEAEAAYRRSIGGDPGYALAHYNLGVLYDLYLKREAEALEHYETYLSLLREPDAEVQRWVIDLRRRLGLPADTEQVARENGI